MDGIAGDLESSSEVIIGYDARSSAYLRVTEVGFCPRLSENIWRSKVRSMSPSFFGLYSELPVDYAENSILIAVSVFDIVSFTKASAEIINEDDPASIVDEESAARYLEQYGRSASQPQAQGWTLIGYDVADVWLNVHHWPHNFVGCPDRAPKWVHNYLLPDLVAVLRLIGICEAAWPTNGPFFGFDIYGKARD